MIRVEGMIDIDGTEYLTAAEAAHLLGVKVATLYAYASRGRLQSYRRGIKRERYYRRSDIDELLQLRPSDDDGPLPPAESWIPYSS